MQKNERPEKPHTFSVEERKKLRATGVLDVEEFDDTKVYAMVDGFSFIIGGKNLKVESFSAESGELFVDGEIESVNYSTAFSKKSGFFARIFR